MFKYVVNDKGVERLSHCTNCMPIGMSHMNKYCTILSTFVQLTTEVDALIVGTESQFVNA